MYSHLPYFLYITAIHLGVRAPGHLPVVWCFVPLRTPLGLETGCDKSGNQIHLDSRMQA
jgi:hypothetical protein